VIEFEAPRVQLAGGKNMPKTIGLLTALVFSFILAADDQLTIHKVTVNTPSGTISGKVIGTGDNLVFVDDSDPSKSFTLHRGKIRSHRTEDGALLVELERPESDRSGTVSNLRITVVDEANKTALTRWITMPVERSRTVTTYSADVRHDHHGQGHCNGKLIADDTTLRYESVSEADHSQTWHYSDLQSFKTEKDHALLKVAAKNGDKYDFNVTNGATAGALYSLVAQKIVDARP
jgi:hypothetical protein